MMKTLFISPHNDDEALFGAYTLMREKPLVLIVTDSYIQFNRGDNITRQQRRNESAQAMELVGCSVVFGGIPDNEISEIITQRLFENFRGFYRVYAPAVQGGNSHHDLIGRVARQVFGNNLVQYTTYTKVDLWTPNVVGSEEVVPTERELELKDEMLDCYQSQIRLLSTAPHFAAVRGRSEWIIK